MSVTARKQVLDAIQQALRSQAGAPAPPLPALTPRQPVAGSLVEHFTREAQAAGAQVAGARDAASAREQIRRWLEAAGARRVVCGATPLVAGLRLSEISNLKFEIQLLGRTTSGASRRDLLLAADAGISDADYGLADTGTLVVRATPEQGRLVSLAPPVHIAVLPIERLLPDLAACFRALNPPEETERSSLLTLITGPSRTADIEQTLTVGVHGPASLFILLVP